ncbi:hypothetical protein BH10ACI1_BH10ACI1_10670 [soil metagenome]
MTADDHSKKEVANRLRLDIYETQSRPAFFQPFLFIATSKLLRGLECKSQFIRFTPSTSSHSI